ncbi:polyprenyl synthetase family protein [Streptococcus anginosus]|uniref:Farnesyl diphosphate synthase n=1 Tax=Streptococcus anginosus subsp. whileyi CCUG 39159 TaxID=1095729 RepID=I0SDX7_STRAP|nr:farnesyl diphosphate synthase [Streptococcus anginosus]AGU83960.1 putative farnesyl diphosphate synthase/geranyltranstransferase [Streptococcus anginosus C238]EID21580.1 polyprenyl synthetase [Streptococcus anginosus subsp. whileyi CCUG 39159]MDB8661863.1 polyprenyl synthetase family protein [Streptococcus anginosus]MDP1385136.1 polyprenyl synthetase family protein [Streptococcus anginosus]QQT08259.1 polyprenyl synthetase family protein [Streptococcus anginosus]
MKQDEKLARIGQTIEGFYAQKVVSADLIEAILYSVNAGGKRIRPLLLLELLEGLGLELTEAHFQVAAALEMIHTGSLIHDDLPAMDDDDYRRGRLTSHKKFGEAMAILAGDSLFLDSYALIAEAALPSQIKANLIAELSLAAGTFGMVGGQVLDMQGEGKDISLAELQTIHANKTGKLLTYPFIAAGLIAEVGESQQEKLKVIGQLLGLAFQVRDDILDITANFEDLGKTPQKDVAAEKATYPAILGLDGAKRFFEEQLEATEHLLAEVEAELAFSGAAIRKIIESLKLNDERKSRCSSL